MQHLLVAGRSLLVGDAIADALLRYAARLGSTGGADDLAIQAIGPDGAVVRLLLLLSGGMTLAAEGTASRLPEPDNRAALAYIEQRLAVFEPSGD